MCCSPIASPRITGPRWKWAMWTRCWTDTWSRFCAATCWPSGGARRLRPKWTTIWTCKGRDQGLGTGDWGLGTGDWGLLGTRDWSTFLAFFAGVGDHETSRWEERMNDPAIIDEILRTARTVAVVGMSDKTWRASHNIGRYLVANGYRVLPVNPALTEVLGLPCHAGLDAAQAPARRDPGAGIDLVDVFRASEHVPAIVDDVIRLGIPYLWLQDDVIDEESVARARAAGVKCVQDDCIFRQHARTRG